MDSETTDLKQRRDRSHARLQRWAWILDDAISLPIIKTRVGLDAIIGLVPVVGDFAGVALSSVLFLEAVRLRAPRNVLTRMGGNLAADFVFGIIPVVGDVLDVAWRANRRNLRTLESWLEEREAPQARRRWPAAALCVVGLVGAGVVSMMLWRLLAQSF